MYIAYREMSYYLINQIPFVGNSVTAVMVGGEYQVFSYDTLIFSGENGHETYFNNGYYSSTTSKLQNMLIRAYGLNDGICKRA